MQESFLKIVHCNVSSAFCIKRSQFSQEWMFVHQEASPLNTKCEVFNYGKLAKLKSLISQPQLELSLAQHSTVPACFMLLLHTMYRQWLQCVQQHRHTIIMYTIKIIIIFNLKCILLHYPTLLVPKPYQPRVFSHKNAS